MTAFRELAHWLCGQSLVSAAPSGHAAMDLAFDLGARLTLHRHDDADEHDLLLTVWDDKGSVSLLANGEIKEEAHPAK
ncbi:MAG: hypothetical protein ACI9KE_000896 [Polyangiales bacterium]